MKYVMVKELLEKYNRVNTRLPQTPHQLPKTAYEPSRMDSQLLLKEVMEFSPKIPSENLLPMEQLPINNMSGQSYGYIVYRKKLLDIPPNSVLTIDGRICDSVIVLIDGNLISKPLNVTNDLNKFGFWRLKNSKLTLPNETISGATLDLVVENWGRNNFGYLDQFNQFKGLWQGGVFLNNEEIKYWEIVPLEFKKSWTKQLSGWHTPKDFPSLGPSLYKTSFFVIGKPQDTYLDMRSWCKGIVVVNGFVLGRYPNFLEKISFQEYLHLHPRLPALFDY
ncbi:hypothetical protein JTB14_029593 [Gonioctena quinquepunctata]|nr:hypothetical protein JTB14_029593 [Gonioctena quinquepunctata]